MCNAGEENFKKDFCLRNVDDGMSSDVLNKVDVLLQDTGGEHTPSCSVELQNDILGRHHDQNESVVCNPCAGAGNLENQFGRSYRYDNVHPYLIKEIERKIREDAHGVVLGQWCYLNSVLKVSNGGKEKQNKITSQNLKWCLLSKGLSFNTHHRYFELNNLVYRGTVDDIPDELFSDAVMFSLFYKGNLFSNKGQKNYIMPFTAEELGCARNDLNVLFGRDPDGESCLPFGHLLREPEEFDFRFFLRCFTFSAEAQALYQAALQVFRFYHHSGLYPDTDWNDSFYDVANAIMGRDVGTSRQMDVPNDRRITRVRTTKGAREFGRRNVPSVVSAEHLPLFDAFFDARDALAGKINRLLVDNHLLLWERESNY